MDRPRLGRIVEEAIRLPRPAPRPLDPAQFMLCGVPCGDPNLAMMQIQLYAWALAQAHAVAQPSIPERDLAAVWN